MISQVLSGSAVLGGPGVTRRRLIGGAASAILGGVALAGCSSSTVTRPTIQQPTTTIQFQPLGILGNPNTTAFKLMRQLVSQFEAANRGIKVQVANWQTIGATSGNLAAGMSGTSPDVIFDNQIAPYIDANLLLPLDKYMREDGVNPNIFSSGQMATFTTPSGTYALPMYQGSVVYVLNLSIFDKMGVSYPDPSWTHMDFVNLAKQLTVLDPNTPQYGASLYWHRYSLSAGDWLLKAFGGARTNADRTQSTLGQPGAVAAGQWAYHNLLWPKLATTADEFGPLVAMFLKGTAVMSSIGSWSVVSFVELVKDIKWQLMPEPIYPNGRWTNSNSAFQAISVNTKYPDQSWALLKWLCVGEVWQKALMKIMLVPPALNSLWPEWETTVLTAAPTLKGKGLHWFQDASVSGYAWPRQYYATNQAQADAIIASSFAALWRQSLGVQDAFTNIDASINALMAVAQTAEQQRSQIQQALSSAKAQSGPVNFQTPSATGLGVQSSSGASLVHSGASGVWTLTGTGTALGGSSDNGTFAGAAVTSDQATITCRVDSITNLTGPGLSPNLTAGLVARGDLSDDTAEIGVFVTGSLGVRVVMRPYSGIAAVTYTAPATGSKTGLISPWYLTAPLPKPKSTAIASSSSANLLLRPIWLRLVRQVGTWQAYTSTDGTTWVAAGPALSVTMAGAWVGLFACANNAAFKGEGTISVTFAGISGFTPSTMAQIGKA